MDESKYVSALSLRWLTPFYDALVEGPMSAFRMRTDMMREMGDLSGRSLLDVGCGTGTFVLMLKERFPSAEVIGLDGDPSILEIARAKAQERGLAIQFAESMSYSTPYPDDRFDVVATSLMLHHLSKAEKDRTIAEMFRVLKPGGAVYGLDFAEPRGPIGRGLRPLTRHFERLEENVYGLLPVMFAKAGFVGYKERGRYVLGSLALFRAGKPQAVAETA